jgi:hypothetical protein
MLSNLTTSQLDTVDNGDNIHVLMWMKHNVLRIATIYVYNVVRPTMDHLPFTAQNIT